MLPVQFIVGAGGNNPEADSAEWNYPALKGINGYIDKSGFGIWGFENYEVLASGGIRLLGGKTFADVGDEALLTFVPVGPAYNISDTDAGKYTNGYNRNEVLNKLVGRLGWIQTGEAQALDVLNGTSKSGRFFNDGSFHTLVSLKNLYDTMELKEASEAAFNAYLTTAQRAIILRCLNGVFNEPEYVSQSLCYKRRGFGNNDQPLNIQAGTFIGWQIKTPSLVDLAVQIDSLSLYFDSAKTFNIYVFNDIKKEPIYTKEVTTEAGNQVVIELDEFILNYISNNNHSGIFYIGYFTDDLDGAKPIWETNVDFLSGFTYGANTIISAADGHEFNRGLFQYTTQASGLNLHISVFRDHTWQIVKKAALFDNLIGLQMAAQSIEQLLWSQRSNDTERGLKNDADKVGANMELTGTAPISEPPRTTGLRKMIEQELTRVKQNFFPKQKAVSTALC